MATFTVPTVDASGITVPPYETLHEELREMMREVYGQDIYIEPDSQDGEFLAILAEGLHDFVSACVSVFNAQSPSTAQGVGLARIVKINGLVKKAASHSLVDLRIVGQVGTVITDGIAVDTAGNRWLMPASVTIPIAGEITVTATAEESGTISAGVGTITTIGNPTRGWQSVENLVEAVPGLPVETDPQLRKRQSVSTMIPSQTVLEGLIGAVASIDGVGRYAGFENDTDITDSNGIPSHSISIVVEGGDSGTIAETIASKKAPGTGTYGTTVISVTDAYGIPHQIKFFRPTLVPIDVEVTLKARTGYTTAVETRLKQTIVDYLNGKMIEPTDEFVADALDPTDPDLDPGFSIGDDVELSRLYTPANLYNMMSLGSRTFKIDQIRTRRDANPLGTTDITLAFNEVATATLADVTVVVVP